MKMKCIHLVFVAIVTLSNVFGIVAEEDDWISMKKKDLCPVLHKEAMCTDNIINFDDVAESIKNMGEKNTIEDDQAKEGEKAANCGDPLKNAICSKDASPLCLEDRTSSDDSAERRVCTELYEKCPSISDRESLNYTSECVKYLKREFSDMTCKSVGVDFKKGVCPRPTRKMPEAYIQVYQAQTNLMKPLEDLLDKANEIVDKVWDDNCLTTVRELPCMPIFCSENDDGIIEMKNKRKDCTKAMECVSKSTEKLNSITGKVLEGLVDELRDGIKNSCETIIKTFEDLSKPSAKEASGVSDVQITISLTLIPVFLFFKMLY